MRPKRVSKRQYHAKKRLLHSLQIDQKIRTLKQEQDKASLRPQTQNEQALIEEYKALKRATRFDGIELEVMNYQRGLVGLPALHKIPPDTPEAHALLRMEREMLKR